MPQPPSLSVLLFAATFSLASVSRSHACVVSSLAVARPRPSPRPSRPCAFLPAATSSRVRRRTFEDTPPPSSATALFGGRGRTSSYAWTEDTFHLEIYFPVPAGTSGKDVTFAPHLEHVGLTLASPSDGAAPRMLMDPSRPLRGKIVLDGCYWTLTDGGEAEGAFDLTDYGADGRRVLTVILEKDNMRGEMEVDEDWGGIYEDQNVAGDNVGAPSEEDAVVEYKEEDDSLDVEAYAQRLGVDLEKMDEEAVDKDMYSSFQMQEELLQNLQKGGFVQEVTDNLETPGFLGNRTMANTKDDGDDSLDGSVSETDIIQ